MTNINTRIFDRELKKGSAELLILSLLEARPRHGYEVRKLIETRSDGVLKFNAASLYPLLYRLEKRGWIEGKWVEKAGQRRRRYYKLTKDGKKVQYMPMVAGILKKVRNSGELLSIVANVVFEKDKFRYFVDDVGEHVLHEPNVLDAERGKLIAVYAIAKTKDGGVFVEVMSRSQIEQVRDVSRAKDNGPWVSWYDEMARKTVIARRAEAFE